MNHEDGKPQVTVVRYPDAPFRVENSTLKQVAKETGADSVIILAHRDIQGTAIGTLHNGFKPSSMRKEGGMGLSTAANILGALRGVAQEIEQQMRDQIGDEATDDIIAQIDAVEGQEM